MLFQARIWWAKGSRFAFNCYMHFIQLVMRDPGNAAVIILSMEGCTQGDVLAMILYGITTLPLLEQVREDVPGAFVPMYADDLASGGAARRNASVMQSLILHGSDYGYYPEPEKSWYICLLEDEAEARRVFEEFGLAIQFTRGQRYVGGFIGGEEERDEWLVPQVEKWAESVRTLARIAVKHPQTAYAGLTFSLQGE